LLIRLRIATARPAFITLRHGKQEASNSANLPDPDIIAAEIAVDLKRSG
jgi:hypothetical protein